MLTGAALTSGAIPTAAMQRTRVEKCIMSYSVPRILTGLSGCEVTDGEEQKSSRDCQAYIHFHSLQHDAFARYTNLRRLSNDQPECDAQVPKSER